MYQDELAWEKENKKKSSELMNRKLEWIIIILVQ